MLRNDNVSENWTRGSPTGVAPRENCAMASLARAGIGPGLWGKATYPFDEGEFPVERTIDVRSGGPGFIDFAHETPDFEQ